MHGACSNPGALGTSILVSPANNTVFYHYPRNTTLAWKLVAGADSYLVEIQYYSDGWHNWYNETVSSALYTFSFIGDQPERWRVTALDGTGAWNDSTLSNWWTFDYETWIHTKGLSWSAVFTGDGMGIPYNMLLEARQKSGERRSILMCISTHCDTTLPSTLSGQELIFAECGCSWATAPSTQDLLFGFLLIVRYVT